jgi:4-carboxymuconolactone decarboxylase
VQDLESPPIFQTAPLQRYKRQSPIYLLQSRPPTARTPSMTDRTVNGRGIYARNFGVDAAEADRLLTERVGPDFTREVFEAAGGLGWESTALTDRDRSIAIIAALVCQNVTDERLMNYLALARRNGVDQNGLTALMVLLNAYIGQPYASMAMETVHRSGQPNAVAAASQSSHETSIEESVK